MRGRIPFYKAWEEMKKLVVWKEHFRGIFKGYYQITVFVSDPRAKAWIPNPKYKKYPVKIIVVRGKTVS